MSLASRKVIDTARAQAPLEPVKQLFEAAIDYAGLFPPSSLSMRVAVEEYASCQSGPCAWMLGRLVLPVSRLSEFSEELDRYGSPKSEETPWRLSAILGENVEAGFATILEFNARNASSRRSHGSVVDSVEVKITRPEEIVAATRHISQHFVAFFEVPLSEAAGECMAAVRESHAFAKVRTGSMKVEQIPSCAGLAGFILLAVRSNVAFKATAGLHHAMRGRHTIERNQSAVPVLMHGFLNLLFAVALACAGMERGEIVALLEEQDPAAFHFRTTGAGWKDHRLTCEQLREARRHSIRSWGSCSFREPLEDLRALGLL
jgi:hypothetical protein